MSHERPELQAVILAGGLATRLRPLTETVPKSLVTVAGRPFLNWQLERLVSCGFTRVVLCVGHLGEQIEQLIESSKAEPWRTRLRIDFSHDGPAPLGTLGALVKARPLLEERFLVTYGDSFLMFDYQLPLLDLSSQDTTLGSLAVYLNDTSHPSNCEVEGSWVVRYTTDRGSPHLRYIDYGAMALRREALDLAPLAPCGLGLLQAKLASAHQLRALRVVERFYEIGSLEGLSELSSLLQKLER